MIKNKVLRELYRGIFTENATFVLVLGLCPTLGITTSGLYGFAMGLATTAVLIGSNVIVSMFRNLIPDDVRIPVYITIAASVVTMIDIGMHAYFYDLYKVLGIFIPLIVANCLILGRLEVFASRNNVFMSAIDGLGSGLGFTLSLTLIGLIREIIGNGTFWGISLFGPHFQPALIAILPPGAFITIAVMMAVLNYVKSKKEAD
jgi:electron transport complex protein RnfE